MNNLSQKTIDLLKSVIQTTSLFNMDVFIMDKRGVRAQSTESYIFLAQEMDLSFLEFDTFCVSEITELKNRLNFIESASHNNSYKIVISKTKELDSGAIVVHRLNIMNNKTSIEVSGNSPERFSLPWGISDNNLITLNLNDESKEAIIGFARTMQNKNKIINIRCDNNVVLLSANDNSGNMANHIITTKPNFIGAPRDFSFIYKHSNILSALKNSPDMDVTFSERGVMILNINNFKIMVFPEKI